MLRSVLAVLVAAIGLSMLAGCPDGGGGHPLPLAVGRAWVMRDEKGDEVTIEVAATERFAGHEAFRIDWKTPALGGGAAYQSEFWLDRSDGVYVAGRRLFGRDLPFKTPYLLVRVPPAVGAAWTATAELPMGKQDLDCALEPQEEVTVPAGTFRAYVLVARTGGLEIRRWLAPGVGLVREEVGGKGAGAPRGVKVLVRTVAPKP